MTDELPPATERAVCCCGCGRWWYAPAERRGRQRRFATEACKAKGAIFKSPYPKHLCECGAPCDKAPCLDCWTLESHRRQLTANPKARPLDTWPRKRRTTKR